MVVNAYYLSMTVNATQNVNLGLIAGINDNKISNCSIDFTSCKIDNSLAKATYNKGKWGIQAMMVNPFTDDYHQGVENVSKLAPNKQLAFSKNFTRMFMLNVSLNLNFGKQNSLASKRIENADTDTGILSGSK